MPTEDAGPLVAVTGATGFLGRFIVEALAGRGARLRVLIRKEPTGGVWSRVRPEIVLGDLEDRLALARLVEGADAVVHAAGLVKALSTSAFDQVNSGGSRNVAEVARHTAPQARLVQISSLAAREPSLSPYAASKRRGEDAARAVSGDRVTIVRPTAIYGPGDREWAPVFQAVALPWTPVFGGPEARITMIHAADAAEAIAELTLGQERRGVWALCDARPDGYTWREILETAAAAQGRPPPRLVPASPLLLRGAAAMAAPFARLSGKPSLLSPGKAREILHPDWRISSTERPPGMAPPRFSLLNGFTDALGVT